MDNWDSSRIEIIEDESGNSSISLSGAAHSGSGNTIYYPNYTGDINENGEIVGKIPVYVKKVGTEEFLAVTSLEYAFIERTDLIKAPEIPDGVIDMSGTFQGCTSLEQAPGIPSSVTNMSYTFLDCTSLTQAPEIPDGVIDMGGTFQGCTSLTQAPEIPSSVTYLSDIFYGCTNLTGNLVINAVPPYPANCRDCLTNAATNDNCNLVLSGSSPYLEEVYETKSAGAHITCPQIDNANTGE